MTLANGREHLHQPDACPAGAWRPERGGRSTVANLRGVETSLSCLRDEEVGRAHINAAGPGCIENGLNVPVRHCSTSPALFSRRAPTHDGMDRYASGFGQRL